jgi:uncharacterized protein YeaO (DUF488 family)
MIRVRRVYDPPAPDDGHRVLVERLWPRGMTKEAVAAEWTKDVAPSPALRTWYGHDIAKWEEFQRRYRAELDASGAWEPIAAMAEEGTVTLVYAARDEEHNSAVVLAGYLRDR